VPRPDYLSKAELKGRLKTNLALSPGSSSTCHQPLPKTREELVKACHAKGLISLSELRAKRIRNDKKKNHDDVRVVRTTGVKAMLRGVHGASQAQQAMQQISECMSQLVHQRGFLVWLHLHRLLTRGLTLPSMTTKDLPNFVRRCFMVGVPGGNTDKKDPAILATFQEYRRYFPPLDPPTGYNNVMTHAAKTYTTAFEQHFCNIDKVVGRIKRYAASRLFDAFERPPPDEDDAVGEFVMPPRPDAGDSPLYNIVSALQDKSFAVGSMHPRQRVVLDDVRMHLGITASENLTPRWLRRWHSHRAAALLPSRNIHGSIRFGLAMAKQSDVVKVERPCSGR